MAKNRLFIKVISSGMQAIAVQVLGSIFFYVTSVYLSKTDFGVIGWMNAFCLLLTTLLSCGLEQVVVRRIAASKRSDWAATSFLAHSAAGFIITFVLLLIFKTQTGIYQYLPWFFAAQGLIYIGVPLKQFLNAKELFAPYGLIAIISNSGKIIAAYLLLQAHQLNLNTVIIILIASAGFELLCLLLYIITKTTFSFKMQLRAYTRLLKEASPQYLSVVFDMSLSRMDWILLGLITTNAVLADYSFAYRAFELARLPLLIIGPIILPRLARLMALSPKPDNNSQRRINDFATVEMFFAMMIPLSINILWVPVVTVITKGKYGDTNAMQFLLLSLCIPIQIFINLLWSVCFSAKLYRRVTRITMICATLNILLNLVLIPYLSGLGAAIAFFATTVLQGVLYFSLVRKMIMPISLKPVLFLIMLAAVIYCLVIRININCILQLLIAIGAYTFIAVVLRQVNKKQFGNFIQFLTQ